jgi:uncharacterized protein
MTDLQIPKPICDCVDGSDRFQKPRFISAVLKQATQQGAAIMKVRALRFLFVLSGILGIFSVGAHSQPSFAPGCHKAGKAAEKQICADAELTRLDQSLTTLYREMDHHFYDSRGYVRDGQEVWSAQRNKCGADSKCIAQRYQEQIQRLSGQNPDYPLAGMFHVQNKDHGPFETFTISPSLWPTISPGEYDIQIEILEQWDDGTGDFECVLNGYAKHDGDGLLVTTGDIPSRFNFRVSSPDPGTLVVKQSPEFAAAEKAGCPPGMKFGAQDVTYARRGPFFNWPDDAYKH